MWLGQDDTVQGLGCPGGTCVGADGNLYEWVSGVDGLGNPVGFWRRLRRGLRRFAPLVRRFAPLLPAGAAAAAAWRFARPWIRRAAPYVAPPVAPVPVAVPVAPVAPEPVAPPVAPMEPAPMATAPMAPAAAAPAAEGATAGWGLGAEDLTQVMGLGYYVGEVAEGPDGNLYQWVQGVDGLGNPFGFWKRLRRRFRRFTQRLMPLAQRIAPFVPGGAAALTVATPFLKQAGVAGYDGLGALYQAPDGQVYQVQGFAADEDLSGFGQDDELRGLSDEELQGLAQDEELRGFSDDEELRGLAQDDELRGLAQEDDALRGFDQDDELRGWGDEELQGFADEDVQGMEGYLRQNGGVSGFDAFVPDAPRETPWFKAPNQAPPLWSPLW